MHQPCLLGMLIFNSYHALIKWGHGRPHDFGFGRAKSFVLSAKRNWMPPPTQIDFDHPKSTFHPASPLNLLFVPPKWKETKIRWGGGRKNFRGRRGRSKVWVHQTFLYSEKLPLFYFFLKDKVKVCRTPLCNIFIFCRILRKNKTVFSCPYDNLPLPIFLYQKTIIFHKNYTEPVK